MAKKKSQSRKTPRTATPRMYGDGAPAQTATTTPRPSSTAPAARAGAAAAKPATTGGRGTMPLEQEYSYVMADLKRLGIAAVGGLAFLLIMGIIFR